MSQRALLVGMNYYRTQNQLQGCINDCHRVADVLRTVYKFPSGNMSFMTDDQPPANSTFPIKENIIRELQTLVQSTKPGDVSVFHYSGHGMLDNSASSTNINNPGVDDALIPVDVLTKGYYDSSREIKDDELWGIVNQIPAGAILFVIIDACHSGSELDLPYNLHIDPSQKNRYTVEKVERRPETQGTIIMISGCKDNQTSLDTVDNNRRPAGALSYALCDYIVHHANDTINFVDFLTAIRQTIINTNPGVPDIQEPQLDFGRLCDCGLNFTLLPNGMATQLSALDINNAKDILHKIYHKEIPTQEEMKLIANATASNKVNKTRSKGPFIFNIIRDNRGTKNIY